VNTWSRFRWFVYFPRGFLSCRTMIDAANRGNSGWDTFVLTGVAGKGICACAHQETRQKWPLFHSPGTWWSVKLSSTWFRIVCWKFTNDLRKFQSSGSKQQTAVRMSHFHLTITYWSGPGSFSPVGLVDQFPCSLPI
jgi:hypothetical protein